MRSSTALCLLALLAASGAPADNRSYYEAGTEAPVRYENPEGSARRAHIATRLPALIARFVQHTLSSQTSGRGHVLPHDETLRQLAAFDGGNSVTWIGHMTVLLKIDGRTILADPWWSSYASPVPGLGPRRYVPPALAIDELPPIDVVIVSHSHYDHLDVNAIGRLPNRERIAAVVPLGLGHFFRERGYGTVVELDWEQSATVAGITFTALPTIHFSQRRPFKLNDTLWAAFGIEGPSGVRVYFEGDSDYGPVHAEIGRRFGGFDIALLSIGGFHNAGVHCPPEDCVRLGRDLGARVLVPLHWGTIYLGEGPPEKLLERFVAAAHAQGVRAQDVWPMLIGETRALPEPLHARRLEPLTTDAAATGSTLTATAR
jgi:L-ascorbate metabolism protein UlaG (beta-lactamase superfamily)